MLLETDNELIKEWCLAKGQANQFVKSIVYRVCEFDDFVNSQSEEVKKEAFDWVEKSIGELSLLHILKGMELFYTHSKTQVDELLKEYDPKKDEDGPMSQKRRAHDYNMSLDQFSLMRKIEIIEGNMYQIDSLSYTGVVLALALEELRW